MFEAADWLVVVGSVSLADNSGKRYRALQILYHPGFSSQNNDYDVGLLRTITDIDMTGGERHGSTHQQRREMLFIKNECKLDTQVNVHFLEEKIEKAISD